MIANIQSPGYSSILSDRSSTKQNVTMCGKKHKIDPKQYHIQQKPANKTIRNICTAIAASLVALFGICFKKGSKVLKGKNASLKDKITEGSKQIKDSAKDFFEGKNKVEEKVISEPASEEKAVLAKTKAVKSKLRLETQKYENGLNIVRYYDNNNRLIKSVDLSNRTGKALSTIENEYNSTGNLIRQVLKDREGKEQLVQTFEYDNKGNVVKAVFKPDGDAEKIVSFKYDNNGRIKGNEVFMDNNLSQTFSYEYNEQGMITGSIIKDAGGKEVSSFQYKYNDAGKLIKLESKEGDVITIAFPEFNTEGKIVNIKVQQGDTVVYSQKMSEPISQEEMIKSNDVVRFLNDNNYANSLHMAVRETIAYKNVMQMKGN